MEGLWRILAMLVVLAGSIALIPPTPARAAGVVGDGTPGSCDENALDAALAGGGLVTFNCGAAPATITVASERAVSVNTQIDGGGLVTLSGGNASRIFVVSAGVTLLLSNIAVTGGASSEGGAIYNEGTLDVTGSAFSQNHAGVGGAILNNGVLTITNSAFDGNGAVEFGGAISNAGSLAVVNSTFDLNKVVNGTSDTFDPPLGGAIHSSGFATVEDSTFTMNEATIGGGIHNTGTLEILRSTFDSNSAQGGGAVHNTETMTILNSTFSGNSAWFGGALTNDGPGSITASTFSGNNASIQGGAIWNVESLTVAASIVAGNSAPTGPNCYAEIIAITSLGSNLSDDDSCPFNAPGDIQNSANINLGPLANNGGRTLTRLPAPNSDAIDSSACLTGVDQRGLPRPSGAGCDIGSVEVQQATGGICASLATGAIASSTGSCPAGYVPLSPAGRSFCIDPYTGRVLYLFGRPCVPPQRTHRLPDDGDLLTCVNRYTRLHRWVRSHSGCLATESPHTIPAMP